MGLRIKNNVTKAFDKKNARCMANGGTVDGMWNPTKTVDEQVDKYTTGTPAPVVAAPVAVPPAAAAAAPQAPGFFANAIDKIASPLRGVPTQDQFAQQMVAEDQANLRKQYEIMGAKNAAISAKNLADFAAQEKPPGMKAGGEVSGPGGPTDDKVPAMLSDGEYVLPADTVEHIGKDNLDAVRAATHKPTGDKRAVLRTMHSGMPHMAVGGTVADHLRGAAMVPGMLAGEAVRGVLNNVPGADSLRDTVVGQALPARYSGVENTQNAITAARKDAPAPVAAPVAAPAVEDVTSAGKDSAVINGQNVDLRGMTQSTFDPNIYRKGNSFVGRGTPDGGPTSVNPFSAEGTAEIAKANAIRQGTIDMQRPAQQLTVIPDGSKEDNIARTIKNAYNAPGAAKRLLELHNMDQDAATSRRGQDVNSGIAAANNQVSLRGQDVISRGQDLNFQGDVLHANSAAGLAQQKLQRDNQESGMKAIENTIGNFAVDPTTGKLDSNKANAFRSFLYTSNPKEGAPVDRYLAEADPQKQQALLQNMYQQFDLNQRANTEADSAFGGTRNIGISPIAADNEVASWKDLTSGKVAPRTYLRDKISFLPGAGQRLLRNDAGQIFPAGDLTAEQEGIIAEQTRNAPLRRR